MDKKDLIDEVDRYHVEEQEIFRIHMKDGKLKKDSRGRNPVYSGNSIKNIVEELNPISLECIGRTRTSNAIRHQCTRIDLLYNDEKACDILCKMEELAEPVKRKDGSFHYRVVFRDIKKYFCDQHPNENITKGDYQPVNIDAPKVSKRNLTPGLIEGIEYLKENYSYLRIPSHD